MAGKILDRMTIWDILKDDTQGVTKLEIVDILTGLSIINSSRKDLNWNDYL